MLPLEGGVTATQLLYPGYNNQTGYIQGQPYANPQFSGYFGSIGDQSIANGQTLQGMLWNNVANGSLNGGEGVPVPTYVAPYGGATGYTVKALPGAPAPMAQSVPLYGGVSGSPTNIAQNTGVNVGVTTNVATPVSKNLSIMNQEAPFYSAPITNLNVPLNPTNPLAGFANTDLIAQGPAPQNYATDAGGGGSLKEAPGRGEAVSPSQLDAALAPYQGNPPVGQGMSKYNQFQPVFSEPVAPPQGFTGQYLPPPNFEQAPPQPAPPIQGQNPYGMNPATPQMDYGGPITGGNDPSGYFQGGGRPIAPTYPIAPPAPPNVLQELGGAPQPTRRLRGIFMDFAGQRGIDYQRYAAYQNQAAQMQEDYQQRLRAYDQAQAQYALQHMQQSGENYREAMKESNDLAKAEKEHGYKMEEQKQKAEFDKDLEKLKRQPTGEQLGAAIASLTKDTAPGSAERVARVQAMAPSLVGMGFTDMKQFINMPQNEANAADLQGKRIANQKAGIDLSKDVATQNVDIAAKVAAAQKAIHDASPEVLGQADYSKRLEDYSKYITALQKAQTMGSPDVKGAASDLLKAVTANPMSIGSPQVKAAADAIIADVGKRLNGGAQQSALPKGYEVPPPPPTMPSIVSQPTPQAAPVQQQPAPAQAPAPIAARPQPIAAAPPQRPVNPIDAQLGPPFAIPKPAPGPAFDLGRALSSLFHTQAPAMAAPQVPLAPPRPGAQLTPDLARVFLQRTNNDPAEARKLAQSLGWNTGSPMPDADMTPPRPGMQIPNDVRVEFLRRTAGNIEEAKRRAKAAGWAI